VESEIDPTLVGARLRRWRDELNLSGREVAAKVAEAGSGEFAWADLQPLELGDALPDTAVAAALAGVFGRSTDDLLSAKTTAELEAEHAELHPDGADDRPSELRERSPYRPGRAPVPSSDPDWDLTAGDAIGRTELQQRFGGGRQGGIAPSRDTRNVLVFSDPLIGGDDGRYDRWNDDRTVFLLCGEGRSGDQRFDRGNRALRDHVADRRAVRVFEGSKGTVIYAGEFRLDPDHRYDWDTVVPPGGGEARRMITFRLLPVEAPAS
jgi:transcriptional regulator with XRE-family HTH domain